MKRKKYARLLSLVMAASMSLTMFPATALANPADETAAVAAEEETEDAGETEAVEEAAEEAADAAEQTAAPQEAASASAAPKVNIAAAAQSASDDMVYTLDASDIDVQAQNVDSAVVTDDNGEVEVDEADPIIESVANELNEMEVLDESDETPADATIALTEEQRQQVLGMFQQYLNFWYDNADVLGVQLPFYLSYDDNKEDGLGVLGEMLCLAGVTVDDVREGNYTFDDLTGMIMNFIYGDQYAVEFYANDIREKRDEALKAVKDSGAKTEAQKLLVLNDWLSTVNSFDMSYIMNSGKDEPSMVAQNEQKHEHYDEIYDRMYKVYQPQIEQMFHDQVYEGIKAKFTGSSGITVGKKCPKVL